MRMRNTSKNTDNDKILLGIYNQRRNVIRCLLYAYDFNWNCYVSRQLSYIDKYPLQFISLVNFGSQQATMRDGIIAFLLAFFLSPVSQFLLRVRPWDRSRCVSVYAGISIMHFYPPLSALFINCH